MSKNEITQPHVEWLNTQHKTGGPHNWVYVGHGHNSSWYKCSECGVEDDY